MAIARQRGHPSSSRLLLFRHEQGRQRCCQPASLMASMPAANRWAKNSSQRLIHFEFISFSFAVRDLAHGLAKFYSYSMVSGG